MVNTRNMDRRKATEARLWRSQPLFMQVPKPLAASVLAGCTLVTLSVNSVVSPSLSFGGIFLLICAFGAWFVGASFGLILGLFLVVVNYLNDQLLAPGEASAEHLLGLVLQLCSSLTVVLMLGVARAALEIEWKYARTDPLTGALNRKAFFEALAARSTRPEYSMLIFADVDRLKDLNDTFGHEKGDRALQNFAATVRAAIRKDDLFARLGGDEFAIFLKIRDAKAAETVGERLNACLNNRKENDAALKCSLGALILPEGSKSIDAELRLADMLMYEAKRTNTGLIISDYGKAMVRKKAPSNMSELPRKGHAKIEGFSSDGPCTYFDGRVVVR